MENGELVNPAIDGTWCLRMINTMPSKPNNMPTLAVLHGSQATGHANQSSDWDVAVLRDHRLTTEERADLRRTFALKLRVHETALDVSDLRSDAPLLRYRVAMPVASLRATRRISGHFKSVRGRII